MNEPMDDETPPPIGLASTLRDDEPPPSLLRTLRDDDEPRSPPPVSLPIERNSPDEFDPYDEDMRFHAHRSSHIDDTLQRLTRIRGVRSATIVELETGAIVMSTIDPTAAAVVAEHVSPLLHRATKTLSTIDGTDTLSLLLISSRRCELLLCSDVASGTAVVIEQDKTVGLPASVLKAESKVEDEEARYRRLLAGSLSQSPGDFASQLFDDDDAPPDDSAARYQLGLRQLD